MSDWKVKISKEAEKDFCYDLAAKLYEKYGDKIFDDIFKEFNL